MTMAQIVLGKLQDGVACFLMRIKMEIAAGGMRELRRRFLG
jgi:hypothetical protein